MKIDIISLFPEFFDAYFIFHTDYTYLLLYGLIFLKCMIHNNFF